MNFYNKIKNYLPIIVFLAGMLPILHNIGTMGLLEPNEALIGSISRYMVETQNFSTPISNEIKHFELPPGVYWITAFGLNFFGNNEFGARFFLSVAAGITALCIFYIAKLFFGMQCAIISCLLLCSSALFQISFRFLSPTAYCTAFESILCLAFFNYLNRPIKSIKLVFWLLLSISFLFSGYGVLFPIIALVVAAIYTGQKKEIKALFTFVPGIVSFIIFGLGWYIIQLIINPGLYKYLLFQFPIDSFINDYNGIPFYIYLLLPIVAVFPWTTILMQQIKTKLKDFKEDPSVCYLLCWAFFPFLIRLLMVSRDFTHFMSSLPPLLLLTSPAFQKIYFKKDEKSEESINNINSRRKHNLILTIITAIIALTLLIIGMINWSEARIVSQTLIFTGTFWLFSALIMTAFMIKKLNKSVLMPTSLLIPSMILFTVPAIQGNEPINSDTFLNSKSKLLNKIRLVNNCDYICCYNHINGFYFYTGKNYKFFTDEDKYLFATPKANELIITDVNALINNLKQDTYFVIPLTEKEKISKSINKNLIVNTEESGWIIASVGGNP